MITSLILGHKQRDILSFYAELACILIHGINRLAWILCMHTCTAKHLFKDLSGKHFLLHKGLPGSDKGK